MSKKLSTLLLLIVAIVLSISCNKSDVDGTYSYRIVRINADEDNVVLIQEYVLGKGMDVSIGATTLISVGTQGENDAEAISQFSAITDSFSTQELDAMFTGSEVSFTLAMICSNTNEEVISYAYSNY